MHKKILSKEFWLICRLLSALVVLSFLSGCAVNPVTGKNELHLVSEQKEIELGMENYKPAQQSQGGLYMTDPGVADYVKKVGKLISLKSDRPELPYEFVVLNNSIPNAWAMPGGKIAVNRGLLVELENEAELAAVLGHEIVHAAARHGAKAIERALLLQAGALGVGYAVSGNEFDGIYVGAALIGANLIQQKYSRTQEMESDYYGMMYMSRAGYDPQAAVTLQEKFVALQSKRKSNWLEGLFASHPPSTDRVNRNRGTSQELPEGGEVGKERYEKRIASLLTSEEAYDNYEKGRQALEEGEADHAFELAEKAIALENREAHFYGLLADIWIAKDNYQAAEGALDEAIRRNKDFYRYYLKRGEIKQKRGDINGAKRDLEKSVALLPTANGHFALGELFEQESRQELAMEHFRAAVETRSNIGKKAAVRLAMLELPSHPERYIQVEHHTTRDGLYLAKIINSSPVRASNISFEITVFEKYKEYTIKAQKVFYVQGPIQPGASEDVLTGIQLDTPAGSNKIRAKVLEAFAWNN